MTSRNKGPVIDPGICRCCGSLKRCRILNHEYQNLNQKEIYSDMFMECFGLLLSHLDDKITDRLVCANCVQRLRDACSFRQQVIKTEETFLEAKLYSSNEKVVQNKIDKPVPTSRLTTPLKTTIKIEHEDSIDDDDGLSLSPLVDDESQCDVMITSIITEAKGNISKTKPKTSDIQLPKVIPTKNTPNMKDAKMMAIQEMIREDDLSHKKESNIHVIIEYSYASPFKCRHNYLLCHYCGQHFTDLERVREHTEQLHNPKKFKLLDHKNMLKLDLTRIDCRLCSEKIDSLDQFKDHITSVHGKKYYFKVNDMVLPFKFTKEEVKCVMCDAIFPYFHALNMHMNVHFSNYVCETCGLGFVDRARFIMHQRRHESTEYPCPTCGKVFKAVYNRDLHVDRIHNKKGRLYCPKCDEKLMTYPQKMKHLMEVHGDAPLTFTCTTCNSTFDNRRSLTLHKRKVHLKDYRHECQTCGQRFFTRFALTNHMPTHTGERNYPCKICGKSYPRLKTLKYHIRIHTNDRRYRCHVCGQAFIQNCSLKGHMKSQHPEYT